MGRDKHNDMKLGPDLGNERLSLHPGYNSDREIVPKVWTQADILRDLLHDRGNPNEYARWFLATAITRQVRTVVTYWQAQQVLKHNARAPSILEKVVRALSPPHFPLLPSQNADLPETVGKMTMYTILFPGSGRDNTGIKDLNDKVLGYFRAQDFMDARNLAIRNIFDKNQNSTHEFLVAGQDYKTATVVTFLETREKFAEKLVLLDQVLRAEMLRILDLAEKKDPITAERRRYIRKLRRVLQRKKNYRFDFYFGVSTLKVDQKGLSALTITYRLVTQSLKGAAISRFIEKGVEVRSRVAQRLGRGIGRDKKKEDRRGKKFSESVFHQVNARAGAIKDTVTSASRDQKEGFYDYVNILVDKVWTVAFYRVRRNRKTIDFGNPDVIRDVRKGYLVRPGARQGNVKFSFPAQKELLELWLVALNTLDFIKDFVSREYPNRLNQWHSRALSHFHTVRRVNGQIDWHGLKRVLTQDPRGKIVPTLGTASEYLFYSGAADQSAWIFICTDIRDLGVDAIMYSEQSSERIEDNRMGGEDLMLETFAASDPLNRRKRHTFDTVDQVMRAHFDELQRKPGAGIAETKRAFGAKGVNAARLASYEDSVKVLLGGDEVFVAAHPQFASRIPQIIADLDAAKFEGGPLNMRAAVTFSRADRFTDPKQQRNANQLAHYRALKLADLAPAKLKELERQNRRMERLIEMLERNEKKKHHAAKFQKSLDALGLIQIFARGLYGYARPLPVKRFMKLTKWLQEEALDAKNAPKEFEWVRFDGTVADIRALTQQADALEAAIVKVVGRDNTHQDTPPIRDLRKLMKTASKIYRYIKVIIGLD